MMKKILAFMLAAGMIAGLSGCDSGDDASSTPSSASSGQTSSDSVAEDAHVFETENLVQGGKDMVWLGPLSMGTDRKISQEFMDSITDKDAYPTVLSKTYVLKFYIEALGKHTNE